MSPPRVTSKVFTDEDRRLFKALGQYLAQEDAAILDASITHNISQLDLAAKLGIAQPSVCYRINQSLIRLRLIEQFRALYPPEFPKLLQTYVPDPIDREVFRTFLGSCNQLSTAEAHRMTQGRVRYRFIRTLGLLDRLIEIHAPEGAKPLRDFLAFAFNHSGKGGLKGYRGPLFSDLEQP